MPNSLQTKKPGTSFHTAVFEEIIYGGGGGGGGVRGNKIAKMVG